MTQTPNTATLGARKVKADGVLSVPWDGVPPLFDDLAAVPELAGNAWRLHFTPPTQQDPTGLATIRTADALSGADLAACVAVYDLWDPDAA